MIINDDRKLIKTRIYKSDGAHIPMHQRFRTPLFVIQEMMKPPLKSFIVILSIIVICFLTEFLKNVKRDKSVQSVAECGNYNVLWSYLWYSYMSDALDPTKFLAYQIIRSDYMGRFLCKTFYGMLMHKWKHTVQKEKVQKQTCDSIDYEMAMENGVFQSLMMSGVRGMMLLIQQLVLHMMSCFFSYFFVIRSARNQLSTAISRAIIVMVAITLLTNIMIVYIMMHYCRISIISHAQLNNYISECLNNHLLVTYCHKEMDECKTCRVKVRKYKRNIIMVDILAGILEMLQNTITRITKFFVYYTIFEAYDTYPKDIVIAVMQHISAIEKNAERFSSLYENIRRSILQAEFAYNFVCNTKKTRKMVILPEDVHYEKADHECLSSSSTSGKCTANRNRGKYTEREYGGKSIKLSELSNDIENVENRSSDETQETRTIIKFVEFAVIVDQRPLFTPINLIVNRNEKILIKGINGIGKSSIIKAFFNMADYIGDIIINNTPLCDIEIGKISSMMSICPQSSLMFRNTIRFNLGYGNSATDEEMMQMCEQVDLIKDRSSTTLNLDDMVMSDGRNFSGGE